MEKPRGNVIASRRRALPQPRCHSTAPPRTATAVQTTIRTTCRNRMLGFWSTSGGSMLLLAVALLQSASPAPRDLVSKAVTAMGGESTLRGLRNITITFYSANFALGQEETPESPARATLLTGTQTIDYAGARMVSNTEIRNVAGVVNRSRRITTGG